MNRKGWTKKASDILLGKRIVKVEYMSGDDVEETGWYSCPVLLQLEDGTWLIPQSDDEGNDGGALGVSANGGYEVLPVIGINHE